MTTDAQIGGNLATAALWSSLDSMEGLASSPPQWYDFNYREHVLRIGTESAGGGKVRYVFNHPTERDPANSRPARVRRSSQADIEKEARRMIDEVLNAQLPLTTPCSDVLSARAQHLETLDRHLSELDLPLESAIRLLSQLRSGGSPQEQNAPPPEPQKPLETVPETGGRAPAAENLITSNPVTAPAEIAQRQVSSNGSRDFDAPALISETKQPLHDAGGDSHRTPRWRASRLQWPSKPDFLEMLWTKRGTQIGRELNRRSETVLHMADKLGLPRPKSNHWLKQKYGEVIEIPENIRKQIAELRQAGDGGDRSNQLLKKEVYAHKP